jgi:MFS superfamily sulfate permease-like transporter
VGLVLLVLCPVFGKIPMNVLGAVIIVGVAGGWAVAG